jgi:ribose/xylose/arabinose/galactoside ABC-type transport system permease subunit
MTLVILSGGIDLSVGSILALASVLCAMLWTKPAGHRLL